MERTRLENRLEIASASALILLIAPAGFGKTTLLSSWIRRTHRRIAWYSIDEREASIDHFLFNLLTAVRQAVYDLVPDFGINRENVLLPLERVNWKTAASLLIQELRRVPGETTLILDDYHFVTDEKIHSFVCEVVTKLPDSINIIISSRTAPALPLSRLRAQGLLRELNANSLRFTAAESAEFLRRIMQLNLSHTEVTKIFRHTEGWIVGLQLAAIGLQDGAKVSDLVSSKGGPLRHSLVYLLEEVLERQPEQVRSFLITTSILDRMTAELCDQVTGAGNAKETLASLLAENLFIVPLDDEGKWFRYHHLFRSLLLEQLESDYAGRIPELRRRACIWYEKEAMLPEAISCAVYNNDWQIVAELIEPAAPLLLFQNKEFREWLDGLPPEAFERQPKLAIHEAWSRLIGGNIKASAKILVKLLQTTDPSQPVYVQLMLLRAVISYISLDSYNVLAYAQAAYEIGHNIPTWTYSAHAVVGSAALAVGDVRTCERELAISIDGFKKSGSTFSDIALRFAPTLAKAQIDEAKIAAASETISAMQDWNLTDGNAFPPFGYIVSADILIQKNELADAEEELQRAHEAIQATSVRISSHQLWQNTVLLYLARNDYSAAMQAADELATWCRKTGNDGWYKVAETHKAFIHLKLGHLDEVGDWLKSRVSGDPQIIIYQEERRYMLYVRWILAKYALDNDAGLLAKAASITLRIRDTASQMGRVLDNAEASLLYALLQFHLGSITEALSIVDRIAQELLAAGAVRPLLDNQQEILQLLTGARGQIHRYEHLPSLARLIAEQDLSAPVSDAKSLNTLFTISDREKEVLGYIANGLTNVEIADVMFVSLNTVKTHIKNLYFKLDAHSRTQALVIARDAKLI